MTRLDRIVLVALAAITPTWRNVLESALAEGAEVVVLATGHDESFDPDDSQLAQIEARMARADLGNVEPAGVALERLRRDR